MQAIEIPLSELISSSLNPRSSVETTFRAQLKTSITASGLREQLKVRKNGKGYIVLDGNTRLSVLQETANDNDLIPCIVLEEQEQTDDTEYALLVNQIRRPIDPWDECSAYNAMIVTDGRAVKDVAKSFGVTPKHVKQRLKLADLPEVCRTYWKEGKANLQALEYMTRLERDVLDRFLEDHPKENNITEWDVSRYARQYLYDPRNAIFDQSELNKIVATDLFGRDDYITDSDRFVELQLGAIEALIDKYNELYQNCEVEHIKEKESLWQAIDNFGANYNRIDWQALDAEEPDLKNKYDVTPDVIQIYTDDKMEVRVCVGGYKSDSDTTPQTDTPVREYSGLLLKTAQAYWRLSFCEYILTSYDLGNSDVAIKYIQKNHWRYGQPGTFDEFKEFGDDKILERRVNQVNKLLINGEKCNVADKIIAIYAARLAAGANWYDLRTYIEENKKFLKHQETDGQPASTYLLKKMKKPMLASLIKEIELDEHVTDSISKDELVKEMDEIAVRTNWIPPLDLLH